MRLFDFHLEFVTQAIVQIQVIQLKKNVKKNPMETRIIL